MGNTLKPRKWYTKILEVIVLSIVWFFAMSTSFYLIWPFLPGVLKLLYLVVVTVILLVYLMILFRYLARYSGPLKAPRYAYCKTLFLWFFIVSLVAYIGSGKNNLQTFDFTRSLTAYMLITSLIIWLVCMRKQKQWAKKEVISAPPPSETDQTLSS